MIINGISTSLRGLFMTYQEVGEAQPKTNYVSIPYGNGSIDLTEALGGVTYNDRIVKADFVIKNYDEDLYSSLKNELHGLRTTLSVKEGYHFIGRVRVLPFIVKAQQEDLALKLFASLSCTRMMKRWSMCR